MRHKELTSPLFLQTEKEVSVVDEELTVGDVMFALKVIPSNQVSLTSTRIWSSKSAFPLWKRRVRQESFSDRCAQYEAHVPLTLERNEGQMPRRYIVRDCKSI